MAITREMFNALQPGVQQLNQQRANQEAVERQAQLEDYFKQLSPQLAGQEQAAKNTANLNTLQDPKLQDMLNQGGSVKAGDLMVGADPFAKLAGKSQQGDAAARMKANQVYNQGLVKLQPIAQAASEGLDLINDPKNIGSLGQARTLMLKSMGMNRYNEKEASAVLPPSLRGYVSSVFNSAGDETSPLNEVQRSNINQFFKGQLDNADNNHQMLKQNAMQMYNSSPYASPQGMQAMQGMGAAADSYLQQAKSKYQDVPATQGPNLTPSPNPGPMDKLMSFFKGSSPQAPVAPSVPKGMIRVKNKGTGQTGTLPASEFDPNQYDKM